MCPCEMTIEKIREKINVLDDEILRLLNKRAILVKDIGKIKSLHKENFYVPQRETEILSRLSKKKSTALTPDAIENIFLSIINVCRALQQKKELSFCRKEILQFEPYIPGKPIAELKREN